MPMTEPLDRSRRDSTLFQFTTRQLRDFIDPNHLLIRIDEQLDFAELVEPLEGCYCPDFGRPAIHPEMMARALLICSLYNIASFRRLCLAISKNIARRWVCFLTIDDPVFDHSSISHFIDRIGRDGFAAIFDGLNDELLRLVRCRQRCTWMPVWSRPTRGCGLEASGMTMAEFKEQAIEENGLFVLTATTAATPRSRTPSATSTAWASTTCHRAVSPPILSLPKGAWLAVQSLPRTRYGVIAHNLARWTARIGLGEQLVTTKTLRRRFFSLAGRLTRSARRLTLHLPQGWPWENQFSGAVARLRARPLPS